MPHNLIQLADGTAITMRRAVAGDIPRIVELLADDPLGRHRDGAAQGYAPYERAFADICGDPHQYLAVAVHDGAVMGTLQVTVVPTMSRGGARRAQIEAVRVDSGYRGRSVGSELIRWAIREARSRDCVLVQLTSDKSRTAAHRFYERLGFTSTHEGFKMDL